MTADAPGLTGNYVERMYYERQGMLLLNNDGDLALAINYESTPGEAMNPATLVDRGNGLAVALRNVPGPGAPAGMMIGNEPAMNASGRVTIRGFAPHPNGTAMGFWSELDGVVTQDVAPDDAGTALGDASHLLRVDLPHVNDAGDLAFSAWTRRSPVVTAGITTGVYLKDADGLASVFQSGDPAPGNGGNTFRFGTPASLIALGGDGRVAFAAQTVGSDPATGGLWHGDADALSAVALANQPAPGRPGLAFGHFYEQGGATLAANGTGQLAFIAKMNRTDGGDPNDPIDRQFPDALWATDLNDQLQLIAVVGDLFDVDDDPVGEDLREIERITLQPQSAQSGYAVTWTDRAELYYHLRFTDDTEGLFVAVVPEPTTAAATLLALASLTRRRRRRGIAPRRA